MEGHLWSTASTVQQLSHGTVHRRTRAGRFYRLALVALALALFSLPGAGLAANRGASHGRAGGANVFVEACFGCTVAFDTLDPALVGGTTTQDIVQRIYAGLLKPVYDHALGRMRLAPDLAAAMPAVSADGRVYTFTIRKDAGFSDGTPVTAGDVISSLNRALLPAEKSPMAMAQLGHILGAADVAAGKARTCKGLAALDERTVRITLDAPLAAFLTTFTSPQSLVLKAGVKPGARLSTDPALVVGAGPFMVKDGKWQYGHPMTLVPNPYYYDAKHIKLTEMDILFTNSGDTEFYGYKAGQFPMSPVPPAEVARYRSRAEFHEVAALDMVVLSLNVAVPPYTNRHFRRALAYAINRDAILDGVLQGTAARLSGWYPRGMLGYDPSLWNQVPRYDPVMARHELALAREELGTIPGDLPIVSFTEIPEWGRAAQQIQRDLKAIGIGVKLHPRSANIQLDEMHKIPLYIQGWGGIDPEDVSESTLGTGGAYNFGNYSNRTVDALFARAAIMPNAAARERLYKQAQLLIMNDAPVVTLYQNVFQSVLSAKYHGLELNPLFGPLFQPVNSDWANVTVSP